MRALHLCFWLHHPYELLGAGKWEKGYFGGENEFKKKSKAEYQPLMAILERNSQRYADLRVSLVVSGVWLEQAERWDIELLQALKKLVKNGNVELVITPYYFSMAAFYDLEELAEQVQKTQEKFEQIFGVQSEALALPRLCYHNRFARWAEAQGFKLMLAGDATTELDWRTPNSLYEAKGCENLKVLFWNRELTEMVTQARDEVTIEVEDEVKVDELETELVENKPKTRKAMSAADFVKSLAVDEPVKTQTTKRKSATYRTIFTAKKYQKQLDLALLRGGLITLHFEPGFIDKWRKLGVIGFLDELFKIWMENAGSHLVGVQEMLQLTPRAEISVRHTVSDGETAQKLYDLPSWWTADEDARSKELYGLREKVLQADDRDLYADFQGLTVMDYGKGGEQYEEILEDFQKRLADLVVQTEAEAQKTHQDVAQSTTVKVKFNHKKKTTEEEAEPEPEDLYEKFRKAAAGMAEAEGPFWDMEDADDFEAALQVFAQRMKWANAESEHKFDDLAEAEVVLGDDMGFEETEIDLEDDDFFEEEKPKTKRKSKKIVID